MGPISITNIISLGLKLVDKFRKLMLRFIAKKLISPSTIAEQSRDALRFRYKSLNWELYNELFFLGNFQSLLSISERGSSGVWEIRRQNSERFPVSVC